MAEGKSLALRAAELWEKRAKSERKETRAGCYSHAAILYSNLKDHEKAADCYIKAALAHSDINEKSRAAECYFKAGKEMELFGDKETAGRHYGRGAVLLERESLKAAYSEPEQAKMKKEAATAYLKVLEMNPSMVWQERTAKELIKEAERLEAIAAKKKEKGTVKNH